MHGRKINEKFDFIPETSQLDFRCDWHGLLNMIFLILNYSATILQIRFTFLRKVLHGISTYTGKFCISRTFQKQEFEHL